VNETTLLLTIAVGAVAAVGNLGSAVIGLIGKRHDGKVQLELSDRQRITDLYQRTDVLDKKLAERDQRIDALEREVAALHAENAELHVLLVAHQITPPRPRLRVLPSQA